MAIVVDYESVRRALGGVSVSMISDSDIDDITIIGLAEAWVIKQVPEYTSITNDTDLLYLKAAVVNKAASLLCPMCATKNKIEVKTIDTSWKKDKIDWKAHAELLESKAVSALQEITTVEVNTGSDASMFIIANSKRYYDSREEL